MRVLATDTSTAVLSVGLCTEDRVLAEKSFVCGHAHAERLLTTVDEVFAEAGTKLSEIDALAISMGPGSFTGLRIGIAHWKGLAFATGFPLIGVSTLDALSSVADVHEGTVAIILDARMKEVFAAAYRFDAGQRNKLIEDRVCSLSEFLDSLDGQITFVGDIPCSHNESILERFPDARILPWDTHFPRASFVAKEAIRLFNSGMTFDAGLLSPVYLRPSQPEIVRNRRLLRN